MDPILIGISILLIGIIAFVYIKLSRKIDNEVLIFNKKLDHISPHPTNKPILIPKNNTGTLFYENKSQKHYT